MPTCFCLLPCKCTVKALTGRKIEKTPEILKKDADRWKSAVRFYEKVQNSTLTLNQPRRNKSNYNFQKVESENQRHSPEMLRFMSHRRSQSYSHFNSETILEVIDYHSSVPMSLHKVSSINRSAGTNPASRGGESSLELEAIAAVHELSFAVQSISVSEMLPRTPDLIFVNVTTLEAQPYCLELTLKGWRITSLRSDCMVGDFTRLDLFTKYYDSLYSLMDDISPGYRERFSEKLVQRLKLIETGEENQVEQCGSPISSTTSSKSSHFSSTESLPIVTPVSSPAVNPDFEPLFQQ